MNRLETSRTRITIGVASIVIAISCCLLFAHQIIRAQAISGSVIRQDVRAMQQPISNPDRPSVTPVVVELFTSEGCSSCPPADALLAELDHDQPVARTNIIVLGEHVDYWDHLGWRDRFSSPHLTQRQRSYQSTFSLDDIYTPQVVVNGSAQFNGTDSQGIKAAIEKAASQTVPIQIRTVEVNPHSSPKSVAFTLSNGPATHPEYIRIYAALVDPTDTTEIRAGENNGRILHHAGVVRAFVQAGESEHMKSLGLHPDQPFSIHIDSPTDLNGMRLVVFAQTKPFGPILGAASCVLSTSYTASPSKDGPFPENRCPGSNTTVTSQSSQLPESSSLRDHLN